jgi:folate-binding Fe-S cluster repair protein YgfZ
MDVVDLPLHKQRYAFFTNSNGGMLDDLMIARREGRLFLVVNAACKDADFRHLNTSIGDRCTVRALNDQALLALQGPRAVGALARLAPGIGSLSFMTGQRCPVGRCGLLRHALRLHRRGRLRDLGAGLARRKAGPCAAGASRRETGRTRRARHLAARSGALPLRP